MITGNLKFKTVLHVACCRSLGRLSDGDAVENRIVVSWFSFPLYNYTLDEDKL